MMRRKAKKETHAKVVQFGHGIRTILVLSQILPEWDARNSPFPAWFAGMEEQFRFVVVDSVGLAESHTRPEEALHSLVREHRPLAFVAFSYGGLLLRKYLAAHPVATPAVYLSTPHRSSASLGRKIGRLIALLERGELNKALAYLGRLTGTSTAVLPESRHPSAIRRLLFGFHSLNQLLSELPPVNSGQASLSLYGRESRLVTGENQIRRPGMRKLGMKKAGMRVLEDRNEPTLKILRNFILRNGATP